LLKTPAEDTCGDVELFGDCAETQGSIFRIGIAKDFCCALDENRSRGIFIGFAAQTGTKAFALRIGLGSEKEHVATQWSACRAARFAVNAGGANTKEEAAVGARVAGDGSLPKAIRITRRNRTGVCWDNLLCVHGHKIANAKRSFYPE
jgi:hypothetical protein